MPTSNRAARLPEFEFPPVTGRHAALGCVLNSLSLTICLSARGPLSLTQGYCKVNVETDKALKTIPVLLLYC